MSEDDPRVVVVMAGTAPDGTPLLVSVDLAQEEVCPATYGRTMGWGLVAACTLRPGHPGPWHVATTETNIVEVWPVDGNTDPPGGVTPP